MHPLPVPLLPTSACCHRGSEHGGGNAHGRGGGGLQGELPGPIYGKPWTDVLCAPQEQAGLGRCSACTLPAPCLNSTFILLAPCLHLAYALPTPCQQPARTLTLSRSREHPRTVPCMVLAWSHQTRSLVGSLGAARAGSPTASVVRSAAGLCPVTRRAIGYLLSKNGTGNAVAIVIGGAAESLSCRPGVTTLILKNRKGFVRMALQHGWVTGTAATAGRVWGSRRPISTHRVPSTGPTSSPPSPSGRMTSSARWSLRRAAG